MGHLFVGDWFSFNSELKISSWPNSLVSCLQLLQVFFTPPRPYSSFPDTTKNARRCRVFNPIDAFLKEFRFYLLIIHFSIAYLNSASVPMKLVPLSHCIFLTGPRLQMKRLNVFINESVSKESASSMCTALFAKQVIKAAYLFTTALPRRTCQGPKKSTPQ